jgi:hypothetical protein
VIDPVGGTYRPHSTAQPREGDGVRAGGSGRHPSWEELERTRRLYGRRGEEAAFHAERNRLRKDGKDLERVVWVSHDDETADHDLKSIDDDDELIYIEVKSTTSDDPGEPFPITSRELRLAARHRGKYFIYRVTRVHEATPLITRYRDPIGLWEEGRADTEVSQARMWLPRQTPQV